MPPHLPPEDPLFRVYDPETERFDSEDYPWPWAHDDEFWMPIKVYVREEAGNRCVRCGHPYEPGMGEWSPCDERCTHDGPVRMWVKSGMADDRWVTYEKGLSIKVTNPVEAQWRILTTHHLNGIKADCRWWNLAALCQRCHLTIQGKVKMDRPYDKPHSEWFVPYVCGFYAAKYLNENLTREEALARREELLLLELRQTRLFA